MKVALVLARTTLRRRMTSWILIALVVAIAGAVTLGCLAAARRTASAHERYLRATNTSDVSFFGEAPCGKRPCEVGDFAVIDGVQTVLRRVLLLGVLERADGSIDTTDEGTELFGLADGAGWEVDRPLVGAGRLPGTDSTDEAFLDPAFASAHNLDVGDEFVLRSLTLDDIPALFAEAEGGPKAGRSVRLRVTGVGISDSGLTGPGRIIVPEPAARQFEPISTTFGITLERGAAGVDAFAREVEQRFGFVAEGTVATSHAQAQRTVRPYVVALAAYAAIAAVIGLVLIAQSAARNTRADADESALLLAIGVTRWQQRARIAAGIVTAATIGAVVAVAAALVASPWSPVGPVGPFEPDPGIDADLTVLVLGGLAWMVLSSAVGLGGIALADRVRRHRVASETRLVRRLPITTATAVRFTRPQPSGANRGSARPAIAGVATAALILTGSVTFAAGLHRLVDTPHLYGWTFDASIFLGYQSSDEDRARAAAAVVPELTADPAVVGVTELGGSDVTVGDVTVPATGSAGAGGAFTLTSGHPPSAPDEVVLGADTASKIDAHVGSRLSFSGPDGSHSADYTVVGHAIFPGTVPEGAWMTLEGMREVAPDAPVAQIGIRFAPNASDADRVAVGERAVGTLQEFLPDASIDLPTPPDDTDGLVGIDQLPLMLGIALGVATMVTLTHTLLMALNARRRDLATLRACGYTVRQVWATVLAHATLVTAAGLVIGVPLGLVAGRWLWSSWADSIGVVDTAVTPLLLLTTITLAAILAAALIAIGPARHASRIRVADALRTE